MMKTRKHHPTIYDVAIRAGVSTATISRVVNRKNCIAAETRRRVQRAIDDLRYEPDFLAQEMARMGPKQHDRC